MVENPEDMGKDYREEQENQEEKEGFESCEKTDWDELIRDFNKWLDSPPARDKTRFRRWYKNLFHIVMGTATAGAYFLFYTFWILFKFLETVDLDEYRKTVYVKKDSADG